MRKILIGALLVIVPATALHAMTVATFLQKAEALERRGAAALLSRDLGLLKTEMKTVSDSLRAERQDALAAGRRPAYCPPEQGGNANARELLDHLRAIPPVRRESMEMRDATRIFLARKYPCPA